MSHPRQPLADLARLASTPGRALGVVAGLCWLTASLHAVVVGPAAMVFWIGHVAAGVLSVGLLASWPRLVRVAAVWALASLPLACALLVLGDDAAFAGATTAKGWLAALWHLTVAVLALLALRQARAGHFVVPQAMALYFVVQLLGWAASDADGAVPITQGPPPAWLMYFPSYPAWWLLSTMAVTGIATLVHLATAGFFPARGQDPPPRFPTAGQAPSPASTARTRPVSLPPSRHSVRPIGAPWTTTSQRPPAAGPVGPQPRRGLVIDRIKDAGPNG